ncbi:MAG: hypothetical protein IJ264_06930 [Clostridia bacterium]|nr:hypothetical protein [Clostridia bacterium]
MNRKVSICTLFASSAQGAAEYLEQRIVPYADISTEDFGDVSVFAARAADLADSSDFVIAAAPLNTFLNAKLRLLKALSVRIVKSKTIESFFGDNAPENIKERDLHAAIPHKANVFPSHDGLFSAFAVKDDNCTVVFLPLEETRLQYLFSRGLDSVFSENFAPKAAPVSAPAPAAPKTKMQELRDRISSVASSGKTVAISPCGSSKMLVSAISSVPEAKNTFVPDYSLYESTGGESTADYIAQSAKLSKENSGADLGIAISDIYNDNSGDGDFVIVCVANSDRAKAAKVYAKPGEDKKLLIVAAIIKLCQMLDELSAAGLVNPNPPKAQKKWGKSSRTPLIVAIIGIAAAIIACVIIAFVLSGRENDVSPTYAGSNGYNQEAETLYNFDEYEYQGGSVLEGPDMGAIAIIPETQPGFISSSISPVTLRTMPTKATSTRQTVTKIITTIATTLKATTTVATTTAKPTTTTTKPTTTATTTATTKPTTTLSPTTTTTKNESGTLTSGGGTFIFRVYGFGHGVGMSQHGAIQMAKNGKSYDEILTNYFIGTTIKTDSSTPLTVKYGDTEIPIVEYLCKTTKREIGPSAPMEALKAQIVSAYTFAKFYNFDVKKSLHAYDSSYDYINTNIHKACLDVLGMSSDTDTPSAKYVEYNGKAAFTCYFASSPGKTASSDSVWGGGDEKYPYLIGGASSPEEVDKSTVEISAADMKAYIEQYAKDNDISITLGDNPAEWLEIISHDGAYDGNTGYITKIRVGNYEMRGNAFRSYVVDFKLRSHCFSFEYKPA